MIYALDDGIEKLWEEEMKTYLDAHQDTVTGTHDGEDDGSKEEGALLL